MRQFAVVDLLGEPEVRHRHREFVSVVFCALTQELDYVGKLEPVDLLVIIDQVDDTLLERVILANDAGKSV